MLSLDQTGPGHYETGFEARKIGTYMVTVEERDGETTRAMKMSTLVIPYSPEYQTLTPNVGLLEQVAEQTGGTAEPKAEDIYTRMRFQSRTLHDIWPALITLLAILFLLDVGLRRVLLPWNEFFTLVRKAILGRLPTWRTATAPAAPESVTLGALLNTKSTVRRPPGSPLPPPVLPSFTPEQQPADTAEATPPAAPPPPQRPEVSVSTHVTGALLRKKRERKGQ